MSINASWTCSEFSSSNFMMCSCCRHSISLSEDSVFFSRMKERKFTIFQTRIGIWKVLKRLESFEHTT